MADELSTADSVESLVGREYQYGFVTDIESDSLPRGLNEDIIRRISALKEIGRASCRERV